MSSSYTTTSTSSFTVTHARHIATKVSTDLKRMQRFYGKPSDLSIDQYEAELIVLLRAGLLKEVSYGFKRDGNWIEPCLRYTANNLAGTATDDDPGRVRPGADIENATFYSYLTYSDAWSDLTSEEKSKIESDLPFHRSGAPEPSLNGYLEQDRTYSAGGRSVARATLRSL